MGLDLPTLDGYITRVFSRNEGNFSVRSQIKIRAVRPRESLDVRGVARAVESGGPVMGNPG